jgi:hypothetical protein
MAVKDDTQYPVLTDLINEVQDLKEGGITLLGNEEERKANEIARQSKEAERQTEEEKRKQRMVELENIDVVDLSSQLNEIINQRRYKICKDNTP